jgi:zinc finger BED domain-containing protein 1 (E3 SUMO-protein ligase ZBED1)
LGTSFQNKYFERFPSIINTIQECKSLVRYFKHSTLNSKLNKTLKQEVETRWNSKLEMLESINDQFELITKILSEKDELERVQNIDQRILQILVNFLSKFREASEFLEGSKYPTLHMVIPWYKVLMNHCQINVSDNDSLIQIKAVVEQVIKNKLKIENIHKIAVFFDPRMKQLKVLEANDIAWVKDQIRSQCANLLSQFTNDDESDGSTNTVRERPSKKLRRKASESTDFISQYYDSSSEEEEESEVDQYLKSKAPKDKNLDILKWWKDHSKEYPMLSILCSYYLSIPASSASSEREFSITGQTISERRTRLNPETVDSILILHSYLQ